MTKRMIIMLACVGLVLGGIFGYKAFVSHMIKKVMSSRQVPAVTVSTINAEMQAWQPKLSAVGTVRAKHGVEVTTELAGIVQNIYFKSGEDVRKGQMLVQLNADVDSAYLNSLKAQAELARSTFNRDKRQFAIKAVSEATLDISEADLKSREAQVKQQEAVVDKKTIRAPFDGRLGISTVNPGQYLNPGEPVVTLQLIDMVYVDFLLPQQEIARIDPGQTVIVSTDTYPDKKFNGTITAINPEVDRNTRNIQIEATVDNPEHELLPGMFTTLEINAGETRQYITLPLTAVTYNSYGETVFVVKNTENNREGKQIAKQTFVTTGPTRGDQVAILGGIMAGDIIVTSGQLKLKSGNSVIVNNKIQPSNEAAPRPMDN